MDWNEDGLKDLIVGEYNGYVRYYRNIGSVGNPILTFDSYLQANGQILDQGDYSTPFVNDWNEDGMKDLLVGDSNGLFYLFINIGTNAAPVFGPATTVLMSSGASADVGNRSGPNVVDLNGDGLKDLVSGEINGKVYYFENVGTNANPVFDTMVYLQMGSALISTPGTSRVTTIDWNGDGDLDLIIGSYDSRLRVYVQTPTTQTMPTIDINNLGGYYIPAQGGYFRYSMSSTNPSTVSVTMDVWTDMQFPNYSFQGPFVNRIVTVGPGATISRNMILSVPSTWPTGYYYYYAYVGDYETNQIYASDYVYFYKQPGDGAGGIKEWSVSGWDEETVVSGETPASFRLNPASPNPFNPATMINFTLPDDRFVTLTIYDISGREVAVLENGFLTAGLYERNFDASELSSGVYFAVLQAGSEIQTQKLLLVK